MIHALLTPQGLGITTKHVKSPTLVTYFIKKAEIQDVRAGNEFCIVLLKDGTLHAMGHANRCGMQMYRHLMYFQKEDTSHFSTPVMVRINTYSVASIACCSVGGTIVKTEKNEWYAFGDASIQQSLAYGEVVNTEAVRIDYAFPRNVNVVKLVATKSCFFMLCDKGDMYVIGNGGYGEMGINFAQSVARWTLCKQNVADVQTGIYNSFVFCKHDPIVPLVAAPKKVASGKPKKLVKHISNKPEKL